jgi:alkanesulfonate monooxygenase SsuD/methylene tetrahydromethanopterin reductase-like flavin-dependent oxidoreductase (luciferase family)
MSSQHMSTHPWVAEAAQGPRFGLLFGGMPDWSAFQDWVQTVEALGFDSLWAADHPLLSASSSWTTLGALAEVTRTVRLGTLVSCASYRHPVVLARDASEVDRISGGRVVIGLGSGDAPEEFRQMGLVCPSIQERQAVLEEVLQIVTALLRGETVTHSGKYFQIHGARIPLTGVQQPRVPILVAGGGPRTTLRLVAQYADACNLGAASWAGSGFTVEDNRNKLAILDRHCADAARSAESVLRTCVGGILFLAETDEAARVKLGQLPPWVIAGSEGLPGLEQLVFAGTPEQAVAHMSGLVAAGFQYLICRVFESDSETLQLLAKRVVPAVMATVRTLV